MKRTSVVMSLLLGPLLTTAAFCISSKPNEITYIDTAGKQRIYSFAEGNNGHLVVNYWDGTWHWADQGLPAGATAVYAPTAITYTSGGEQLIYVFAAGSTGHLYVDYWDGLAWHWADQGLPAGASAVYAPTAITYNSRIYVFAQASTGHLVVNYWDTTWHWADQGLPAGASAVYSPAAITYASGGQELIYVFARASTGHLVVNYWDTHTWHWADQGLPAGASAVYSPTAITYVSAGHQLIYTFAESSTGHLVVNYWDTHTWHWADQGLPAGNTAVYFPSAISYPNAGLEQIYVFAEGSTAHLVVNYWITSTWNWADQGNM